jgi:plasmid maintenance system killer protein
VARWRWSTATRQRVGSTRRESATARKLKDDRAGSYSIRINDQWRITFRIEANRALDVTIEDYH